MSIELKQAAEKALVVLGSATSFMSRKARDQHESVVAELRTAIQQAESEPLTDTFVQTVPDKCDRILWHGRYLHLPIPSLISNAPSLIEKAIQQAEAKTEETVDFPAGAIVNGRTLIERIEAYPFEILCRGLRMCSDWHELRRCFEHLADYVSTHPAPGVPDDVVRDAIATVREQYRGTDWGKAAEGICDAIDAAMLAAKDVSA